MKITWYGHSTFLMTDNDGVRILTDPCDRKMGYNQHDIEADIVTISHDHFDHNFLAAVKGEYTLVNTLGEHECGGLRIQGFESFHDDCGGKKRGSNIMFLFEMDGIRVLHCGDLGALPKHDVLDSLGRVDVLLVPIGGIYTIDASGARELANLLKPSVVIPMHYKTSQGGENLNGVAAFLNGARDCKIHRLNQCCATIERQNLGTDRILVLDVKS